MVEDGLNARQSISIMGYYGARNTYHSKEAYDFPERITDDFFRMIAESGIKEIVYSPVDYATEPELVKKSLDFCQKYGMGYYVLDSRIAANHGKDANEIVCVEQVKEYLSEYSHHPAFRGVYLVDEPRTEYYLPGLDGMKDICRYRNMAHILQYELHVSCYINLFPIWNWATQKPYYERYVEEYCETLKPRVLMWDHYPYYPNRHCERLPVYFYNMNVIRKYANKYHIPFVPAIQAGSQWNDEKINFCSDLPYYPNEAQFQWNINTCMAFGAKGIFYFPIIQPEHFAYAGSKEEPAWDFRRNGIIGADGGQNQWWYYAKSMNRYLEEIGEVLSNSTHKGIIANGDNVLQDLELVDCVMEMEQCRELKSIDGQTILGLFDYNGKTLLYVVNYSTEDAQNITLQLNNTYHVRKVLHDQTLYEDEESVCLNMAAGEGALIIIEKI